LKLATDNDIKSYWSLCEYLARPFVGQHQAEQDDLVQEGLIYVWHTLQNGKTPSKDFIQKRMRNWVRFCERLVRGDGIEYERAMYAEDPEYLTI
jgi:DNA-directed RNA polymerase specialized sigma24 family protein